MEFISKVHGKLEYEEKDIIEFKKEIPGLVGLSKFILKELDGYEPFKLLQSLENDELGLILLSPFEVMDDYEVKLTDETIKNLKINAPEDIMLYTTVTLNSDVKKITTNLKAPIVINIIKGLGEQIIVDKKKYEIKHPMYKG